MVRIVNLVRYSRICVFVLLLIGIQELGAKETILNERTQVFENTDCNFTNTCSLKRVKFYVNNHIIEINGVNHYGTTLYAWYETDSISALQDYAFVQFIKGCSYGSTIKDGAVRYLFTRIRNFFDGLEIFLHPSWVIDSRDKDPVYFSVVGSPRHYFYRWNTESESTYWRTERIYGDEQPSIPMLYIFDIPTSAFYVSDSTAGYNRAENVSLKFKIGIYRTRDVPKETVPEDINFAESIFSFEWQSSFVFNHGLLQYESPQEISPACNANPTDDAEE